MIDLSLYKIIDNPRIVTLATLVFTKLLLGLTLGGLHRTSQHVIHELGAFFSCTTTQAMFTASAVITEIRVGHEETCA